MLFWALTSARKSSAGITCNLLFIHRRQSVVRWMNLLWILQNRAITDRFVDFHAYAIVSVSEDIETILFLLNAKHSTFGKTTRKPAILTNLVKRFDFVPIFIDFPKNFDDFFGSLVGYLFWFWTVSKSRLVSLEWPDRCPRKNVYLTEKETVSNMDHGH